MKAIVAVVFMMALLGEARKNRRTRKVHGFRFKQSLRKQQDFDDILKDFNGDNSNNMEQLQSLVKQLDPESKHVASADTSKFLS